MSENSLTTASSSTELSQFGSSSFIQWSVPDETKGETLQSPDLTSLIQSSYHDLTSVKTLKFVITGGGVGEVSSFEASPAKAPRLELNVEQGNNLFYTRLPCCICLYANHTLTFVC